MALDARSPLSPALKPKLSNRVAAALRARLASGEIEPGRQLPTEQRLTQQFGVSRTVVREAIATLAADGLVTARQGVGVFAVPSPASALRLQAAELGTRVSQALNVLEVRLAIEVESAALAAQRRNPSQEAAIQEAFFEFDRLLQIGEPTGPADFAFHRAIAAATNNSIYIELLEALGQRAIPCDVTSPFSTELAPDRAYQEALQREHLAILDAVLAGHSEAARKAMRTHLSRSQTRYRGRLHERTASYGAEVRK